jgi:hypothetical protein
MTYEFSKWWLDEGVELANLHSDMGLPKLRIFKIALRPVELLRKYTIRPVEQGHAQSHLSNVTS